MTDYRRRYADVERTHIRELEELVDDKPMASLQFDNAEWVHYGLAQIGWVEREVLTLYFLADLSIDEIGRVLEIPTGTVKSRLSRARAELRSVLEQQIESTKGKVSDG